MTNGTSPKTILPVNRSATPLLPEVAAAIIIINIITPIVTPPPIIHLFRAKKK